MFVIQDKDVIELDWNQDTSVKTIPWDKPTDTALISTVPKYNKAVKFTKHFFNKMNQHKLENAYLCNSASILKLDDVNEMNLKFQNQQNTTSNILMKEETIMTHSINMQTFLLRYHYRLGHLSFKKLKILAILGIFSRKLAKVRIPK